MKKQHLNYYSLNIRNRSNRSGQIFFVGLLLVVITLFLAFSVNFVRTDSKATVSFKKKTTAFHLAEAGIDKGFWKLQETSAIWDSVETTPIPGYNFDVIYTDIDGGEYTVRISPDPGPNPTDKRVIESSGRTEDGQTVRSIVAVYERPPFEAGIWTKGGLWMTGNARIHWGPMKSLTYIELTGAVRDEKFPRKYAKYDIIGIDSDPSGVNFGDIPGQEHWWSFYDVSDPPTINFTILKDSAIANDTCFGLGTPQCPGGDQVWNNASPGSVTCPGGCPNGGAFADHFDEGLFWYFEKNLELRGQKYIKGTIIVMGDLVLRGGGDSGPMPVTPPINAWQEYPEETTVESEFPADAGDKFINAGFNFGVVGCGVLKDCVDEDISIWGFVYVVNQFSARGSDVVVGSLMANIMEAQGGGTIDIYFDPDTMVNVPLIFPIDYTRVEWREVVEGWPL